MPEKEEVVKAGVAAGVGAAGGFVAASAIGNIGVVAGGGAFAVGAAPFVAAGAVLGLAGYGLYRLFRKDK